MSRSLSYCLGIAANPERAAFANRHFDSVIDARRFTCAGTLEESGEGIMVAFIENEIAR